MKRFLFGLLLLPVAYLPVTAQEMRSLTPEAAAAIMDFYNDPATIRVRGETRIPDGSLVAGNLASLGGPLVVAGTVRGDVVVINGDLQLLPAGRIEGTTRVVGGRVEHSPPASAEGVVVYYENLRFRREGDLMVAPVPESHPWAAAGRPTRFGRFDLTGGIHGSYNRAEGLPIMLGPRLEFGRSNPTAVNGRLIYQTRKGLRFHPNELGYDLRLEQYMGGGRGMLIGVGAHNVVDPIEDAGLSDTENSLATFVFHEDHRDHYEREGWSAYLRFIGTTTPYDARIEYRDETHRPIQPGAPWALLRNDTDWRAQPHAARGTLRSVTGSFQWDGRDNPVDPAAGWLVTVEVEQGLGGSLRYPAAPEPTSGDHLPVVAGVSTSADYADSDFTFASVDARRYLRVGPRSRLAFRVRAAGAPDMGALPVQRQLTLGGEGTLPGFNRFAFDCGARSDGTRSDGFYPYYGCDRLVLLQGEYRFALLTDTGISRRLGLDFDLFATPELVLFANAGRAWIEARALAGRTAVGPRYLRGDAGVGLRMGRIGIYLAAPVTSGGSTNFFIRLGPRI